MDKFACYPPQDPREFEFLCQLIRERKPSHIMEVGCRYGQSALRMSEAAMPGLQTLTCIDLPDGPWGTKDSLPVLTKCLDQIRSRNVEVIFHAIDSHSPKALEIARGNVKSQGVLFIDGDHRYEGVKKDYYRFMPCVEDGGFIAIHDIRGKQPGVTKFWDELASDPKLNTREIVAPKSSYGMGLLFL